MRIARRQRAAEYVEQGFTGLKFDPTGGFSAYDPRQPTQEALERTVRLVRLVREAVGRTRRSLVGHARAIHDLRGDPLARSSSRPTIRCGSRSRCRPKCRSRWRSWRAAPAFPSPPASGSPPSTNSRASWRAARPISANELGPGRAACSRRKRWRRWPRCITRKLRRTSIAARWSGAANIQIAACSPNFLILESIQQWGGIHAQDSQDTDSLGSRAM